jgi:hypothetical protein
MKKLVLILVVLFAATAIQAQDGGRAEVPECYKCLYTDSEPLQFIKYNWAQLFMLPYLPKVEGYIKADDAGKAYRKDNKLVTNPGIYIQNQNHKERSLKKYH